MMPVQSKKRYGDEETGQLLEGMYLVHAYRYQTLTQPRRVRLRLHPCRRRAQGEPDLIQVPSNQTILPR